MAQHPPKKSQHGDIGLRAEALGLHTLGVHVGGAATSSKSIATLYVQDDKTNLRLAHPPPTLKGGLGFRVQ